MPNVKNIIGKGFDKNPQNINRTGANRKVSIKKELEKLLGSDGTMTLDGKDIVKIKGLTLSNDELGQIESIKIKVPTQEALAMKMIKVAMGRNDHANTLRAIIQILEQFDGKPRQEVGVEDTTLTAKVEIVKQKGMMGIAEKESEVKK